MPSGNDTQFINKTLIEIAVKQARIETLNEAILNEAKKTNGRVTKLEDKVCALEELRTKVIGGGIAIGLVFGALYNVLSGPALEVLKKFLHL